MLERLMTTQEAQDVVQIAPVIDHPLEHAAELVDLLIADAAMLGMVLPLHPAVPAAAGKLREGVDPRVSVGDLFGREKAGQEDIAVEIEQMFFEIGRDRGLWMIDQRGPGAVVVIAKALGHATNP